MIFYTSYVFVINFFAEIFFPGFHVDDFSAFPADEMIMRISKTVISFASVYTWYLLDLSEFAE